MPAKIIYNPYSGRWQSEKKRAPLEAALKAARFEYELSLTEGRGHAETLASQAVQHGYSPIIAAGGDGTINEVVNGMLQSGVPHLPPLGLAPQGTANDLFDSLGLPRDYDQLAQVFLQGKTRRIDLVQANNRYFVNNAGLGLEPLITTIHERISWLSGVSRYLVSTIWGILQNPKWEMDLEWDSGVYHGPVTLVSISNCARTGGVFYTVPHADPYDGKISFVFAYLPTRRKIFQALPMIMKPAEGNITEHPAVREIHTTWLKVRIHNTSPTHTDGELLSRAIEAVEYKIFPAGIEVILPG